MKFLAIIPARGGSKGLPGKNIKILHGKPLIAYTIEEAKKSKYINEIHVSSDDRKILALAESLGIKTKFVRPKELATDTSAAIDTYLFCIEEYKTKHNLLFDAVIILQPTSPLRTVEDIDACIELFMNKNADSIISYTKESHPIFWNKYIDTEGKIYPIFDDVIDVKNRQDYTKTYYPNGSVYVFKIDLLKKRQYFSEKTFAYIMPRNRSVDIDTIEDFEYAEFLMSRKK